MSAGPSKQATARPVAFELKGVMTSLAVLRLHSLDLSFVERQLRIKIALLPQFFQDAPVVLDLGAVAEAGAAVPLGALVKLLRECHLVPVAITNASDSVRPLAAAEGLGVMPYRATAARGSERAGTAASPANGRTDAGADVTPPPEAGRSGGSSNGGRAAATAGRAGGAGSQPTDAPAAAAPSPGAGRPAMVVRQPVRSGQVIYAERSDLVVLGPVNPGAEVIADGHVHLYGALRGRAIAGAQGFTGARIFCQRLEAELVAVGGAYVLSDDIPAERRGAPAQVFLSDGECRIAPL